MQCVMCSKDPLGDMKDAFDTLNQDKGGRHVGNRGRQEATSGHRKFSSITREHNIKVVSFCNEGMYRNYA